MFEYIYIYNQYRFLPTSEFTYQMWFHGLLSPVLTYRYKIQDFYFPNHRAQMGILINNMKIIHTSTFTIIPTNFNHYLETTQRKQREIIIRRKESVSHKEDTIYEYIYYIKKSLKIIIVFFTLNILLFFSW